MASSPENSPSQDSPTSPPASPPPSKNNNNNNNNSNNSNSKNSTSSGSSSSSYSPPPPPPDNNSNSSNNSSSSSDSSSPSPPDNSNSNNSQEQGSTPSPPSDSGSNSNSGSTPAPKTSGNNNNNNNGGSSNTPAAPKNNNNSNNNNNNNNSKAPPSSHNSTSNDGDNNSPATNSGSPPDDDSSNSSGNQKAIIGVAVGAALLLFVFCLFLTICCRRKKKKKKQQQANQYYNYAGPNGKGDQQYYMGQQQPPWQNQFSPDGMKPPMQSGMNGSPANWGAQPHMSGGSGEMSSSFSGPHRAPMPPPSPTLALGFNKSTFSFEELAAATNGFSDANLLGQGGFGYVHKGVLPNGKEVAVKSLKSGSGQGEREFQAEVEIISRVHHRHLVSLVGYCIAGGQRMLVYEFVPNNTLEYHLHGKHLAVMEFQTRLQIALGSAKGLAYLHEDCHPKIIHRDIKAANILIEHDFEAKVADFGLAKLSSDNYTHVSTRVMGTFGYLAPEYASSGKLSEKSDVFSFGVMLLELVTGKQPVDHTNAMDEGLVDWARPLLTQCLDEGNFDAVADPMLERNYNPLEMARLVGCAAAAIRHSAKKRPRMSQIVRALEGESSLDDLNEGVKPGQSSIFGATGATGDYSKSSYNADMQRFRQLALASGEVNSSDYSSNDSRDMTPRQQK